jgi:predicted outer membrane repeat protein
MKKNTYTKTLFVLLLFAVLPFVTSCPPPPVEQFIIPPREEKWYFVSALGSDSNDGLTEEAPFKTLRRALQAAASDPLRPRVFLLDVLDDTSESLGDAASIFCVDGNVIKRGITLGGEEGAGLAGDGGARAVLRVKNRGDVSIRTISISGGGDAGLYIEGASGAFIESGVIKNNFRGVYITGGSALIMNGGSLEGNINPSGSGGGVYLEHGSSFTMGGNALIANNTAQTGAAVFAQDHTKFVMTGSAEIIGNTALGAADMDSSVCVRNFSSLTLGGNANIHANTGPASVSVQNRCLYIMQDNVKITDTVSGSGVYLQNTCDFRMVDSALISGNGRTGVTVDLSSAFTMKDNAVISGNTSYGIVSAGSALLITDFAVVSDNSNSGIYAYYTESTTISGSAQITRNTTPGDGGGFYGGGLTLTEDAVISHNRAAGKGGGILALGSVTISGSAHVFKNTSAGNGGGVYVAAGRDDSVTLSGTAGVTGNESTSGSGGGVAIHGGCKDYWGTPGNLPGGSFIMRGGEILGNTASGFGGGVFLERTEPAYAASYPNNHSTFSLEGGSISGNSAQRGGGVAVRNHGYFTKAAYAAGGIYGANAPSSQSNTASSGGKAVWVSADDSDNQLLVLEKTVTESRPLVPPYPWVDP